MRNENVHPILRGIVNSFSDCTRAADPPAPAADQDLSPALEASIAAIRADKSIPNTEIDLSGRHVLDCECDYDLRGTPGEFVECSTDPRCKALRERVR